MFYFGYDHDDDMKTFVEKLLCASTSNALAHLIFTSPLGVVVLLPLPFYKWENWETEGLIYQGHLVNYKFQSTFLTQ